MESVPICPGCGLRSGRKDFARDPEPGASAGCLAVKDELSFYTLGRRDAYFIHQLLVDAYAAQHATPASKPITTAFALIGLFLFAERGFTGKEVQRAHMALARRRRDWPQFEPPRSRGPLTVADVVAVPPGEGRDAMLKLWAESVWAAWGKDHARVAELAGRWNT
ncbi:MAG: DUF5946 family protein [Deltaproteobacteria bacterium]